MSDVPDACCLMVGGEATTMLEVRPRAAVEELVERKARLYRPRPVGAVAGRAFALGDFVARAGSFAVGGRTKAFVLELEYAACALVPPDADAAAVVAAGAGGGAAGAGGAEVAGPAAATTPPPPAPEPGAGVMRDVLRACAGDLLPEGAARVRGRYGRDAGLPPRWTARHSAYLYIDLLTSWTGPAGR